jgi:hypothetical protein
MTAVRDLRASMEAQASQMLADVEAFVNIESPSTTCGAAHSSSLR